MGTMEFSIPLGQVIAYMFLSTFCFFYRKDKLGLAINFVYVFNWGFLYGAESFVDTVGRPTMGLFAYLASGLTLTVWIMMGFFREE